MPAPRNCAIPGRDILSRMSDHTQNYPQWLRIIWTTFCGIACVLLIALWVRSYWRTDIIFRVNKSRVLTTLGSSSGSTYLIRMDRSGGPALVAVHETQGWKHSSDEPVKPPKNFEWASTAKQSTIRAPIWFLVILLAFATALPWFGRARRFSLRTLLIATTLIALALGTVALLSR